MMNRVSAAMGVIGLFLFLAAPGRASELILPQNRGAFYADESIELVVAGLDRGQASTIALTPRGKPAGIAAREVRVEGDGSTVAVALPPLFLAPGVYEITLDGKPTPHRLTISAGVNDSTMLITQTIGMDRVRATGGNFFLGNAFEFGLVGPDGLPSRDLRRRSGGLNVFDQAVAADLPTVVYMYWTGYVTHKPWGTRKGWAESTMGETMRTFSLHAAQRLRRYRRNLVSVGTIDEPGLGPGKTPAGGWASGFANWDSGPWYEARGWKFTDDPAAGTDDAWRRYATIRGGIIGARQAEAHADFKRVWPDATFSADNYAAFAVMDGADPMNQRTNDIPATHVFLDWGTGRLGTLSALNIEKSHDPTAHLAVAMNGQLMGGPMPSDVQQVCYRGMMNAMLAAGLHSNWWLNWSQIEPDHLKAVNEPARRLGPLFLAMRPDRHDVALLWSQSEIMMRCKPLVARAAHLKPGAPMTRTIAVLSENSATKGPYNLEITTNGEGGNYRDQVQSAHLALNRAGYPTHFLHERILPDGILKNYKVLFIVGQTAELPPESRRAIADFVAAGGQVVVDRSTTVRFPGALTTDADFHDPAARWAPLFLLSEREPGRFKTPREASYYQTNHFMDEPARAAVAPIKAVMAPTKARPIFSTDSVHLMGERHNAGQGSLYMVLNAHDHPPDIPETRRHMVWNYAPYSARFKLEGIPAGSAVYRIEGTDWTRVSRVNDFDQPQQADFAATEMKLYLVAPHEPSRLRVGAASEGDAIQVQAELEDLPMPWPLTVTIARPDGSELFHVHRATDALGRYDESFPLGGNTTAGTYTLRVNSPAGPLAAESRFRVERGAEKPRFQTLAGPVRYFDTDAVRSFLAGKPELSIALAGDRYRPQAQSLAVALRERGLSVQIADERSLFRRHRYPRVFDPYLKVYRAIGPEKRPDAMKGDRSVKLAIDDDGRIRAIAPDGTDLGESWRDTPNILATVVGKGFIDYQAADAEEMYEPGCKIHIDAARKWTVVLGEKTEVKATPEARERWSRPWTRLGSYSGAFNLTPQLPEGYACDRHLILLGDSTTGGELVAALQASELLPQAADARYPGPGKALLSFAWSPFALEKNAILIGASDDAGVRAGVEALLSLVVSGDESSKGK
ncbi:MAG: hypothetical protein ACLQGP_40895 [Isosphaeraceae bacterium]